jgi:hypothetical protein
VSTCYDLATLGRCLSIPLISEPLRGIELKIVVPGNIQHVIANQSFPYDLDRHLPVSDSEELAWNTIFRTRWSA